MKPYDMSVAVRTQFIAEQSSPDQGVYAWTYTITIRNTGSVAAQVVSRHWVITDAVDRVQEVRGLGVVGHQPLLQPGEVFEYTSGTTLPTPTGMMRGEYYCTAEDGTQFEVEIPAFTLAAPNMLH